jgi:hypothetical protein
MRNFLRDLIPILASDIRWMNHWANKKKRERLEVTSNVIAGTKIAKQTAYERLKEIEQALEAGGE